MYIQGEWLKGNCGATVECTKRSCGLKIIVERILNAQKAIVLEGILERLLDVQTGRVNERELLNDSWIYTQVVWLRGNCGASVGSTYRALGYEKNAKRKLDLHKVRVAERELWSDFWMYIEAGG